LKSLILTPDIGKPNLFQYLEYRVFLADYVEWRQKGNTKFSKRAFSQKYFGSTAILYTVIQGGRDLGPKLRVRCSAALNLGDKESQYFDFLVQHNQAKTDLERNFLFDKLSKFRHSKPWVVKENQHRYYSKWYYGIVFAYLGLDLKKSRPAEIAKEILPAITTEQVQEAIDLLLELEMIRKSETGYALTKNQLISGDAFLGEIALNYNRQIHDLSTDLVKDGFRKFKAYNTQVLTLSDDSLKLIHQKMATLDEEIQEIVAKDKKTDKVCTIVVQIMPNTR
jgi:uncharacterized protein (TIGR02147 family)